MSKFTTRAGGVPGFNPLRSVGPKVFISYSFKDQQVAIELHKALATMGFQVRMEDETSLLNERLPEILAARIEDAEGFIQIRTTVANASAWVREELDIAEKKRRRDERLVILPVVIDKDSLDERAAKWVYVDASTGLTPYTLNLIRSVLLKGVCCIRTKHEQPSCIHGADVEAALIDPQMKRVVVDADGFWFDLLDEVLTFARILLRTDSAPFIDQEDERRRRLIWSFARIDVSAKTLLQHLRASVQQGIVDRGAAEVAFQTFYRIVFEHHFWPIIQHAARVHCFSFDDDVEGLSQFGEGGTLDAEAAAMAWALRPSLEDRARLAPGGPSNLIKTGMDSSEFHSAYVYFPDGALGEDWKAVRVPQAIVMQRDWAMFGLPQIAARAVGLTQRHSPDFAPAAYEEIEKKMGWVLTDYRHMGPP